MPLFDLTLSQTFCMSSSLLCMLVFFLAEPVTEYRATLPPTRLIGAQTQLMMARRAARCTSASAIISHSAAASSRFIDIVIERSGMSTRSHRRSITLGTTEHIAITSRQARTVSALDVVWTLKKKLY
jgi:hypothetical protein